MTEIRTRRRSVKRGKIIPFEFRKELESYLRKQAPKEGKTMVQFVETLLEEHRGLKSSMRAKS